MHTLPSQVDCNIKHLVIEDDVQRMEYVANRNIIAGEVVSIYSPIHTDPFMFEQDVNGNLAVHPDLHRVYSQTEGLSEEGHLLLALRPIKKGDYLRVTYDPLFQHHASLFCNPVPYLQPDTMMSWIAAHTPPPPAPIIDTDLEWMDDDTQRLLDLFE